MQRAPGLWLGRTALPTGRRCERSGPSRRSRRRPAAARKGRGCVRCGDGEGAVWSGRGCGRWCGSCLLYTSPSPRDAHES
eukprot:1659607-Prymnesium_polylepis.1